MRLLLLGSGGRESALAWALARSSSVTEVVAAPGNPGIAEVATTLPIDPQDVRAVVDAARALDAGLVVVGPEAPLVGGVADALRAAGRRVFGPDSAAARIEGSKAHAKDLMRRAGIATARGRAFSARNSPSRAVAAAVAYMDELGPPYVVKADGLAGGKGVVVTGDRAEAVDALEDRLVRRRFGTAGATVVIEEYLEGPEVSLIAFVDGRKALVCAPAQDYKRAYDDDRGPNTGGMGAYSPVPACPDALVDRIAAEVVEPMVAQTAAEDPPAPFVGALYAGLALTRRGPVVVEFNVRFGDPEAQALIPRLSTDLGALCLASATGELEGFELEWSERACVTVVLAGRGYPGASPTGVVIEGLDIAAKVDGAQLFHAGTARRGDDIVTAGGRVLAVTALGDGFAEARARAYEAASHITFVGCNMRTDIALRAERFEGGLP
jgi:phosphoribosylamine--glycine ligase